MTELTDKQQALLDELLKDFKGDARDLFWVKSFPYGMHTKDYLNPSFYYTQTRRKLRAFIHFVVLIIFAILLGTLLSPVTGVTGANAQSRTCNSSGICKLLILLLLALPVIVEVLVVLLLGMVAIILLLSYPVIVEVLVVLLLGMVEREREREVIRFDWTDFGGI